MHTDNGKTKTRKKTRPDEAAEERDEAVFKEIAGAYFADHKNIRNCGMIAISEGVLEANEGIVSFNKGIIRENRSVIAKIMLDAYLFAAGEEVFGPLPETPAALICRNMEEGSVGINAGALVDNFGTVGENTASGYMRNNVGVVERNCGTIYGNYEAARIGINAGTVEKNTGRIGMNTGRISAMNAGIISVNKGEVAGYPYADDRETLVRYPDGRVENNLKEGVVTGRGVVVNNWGGSTGESMVIIDYRRIGEIQIGSGLLLEELINAERKPDYEELDGAEKGALWARIRKRDVDTGILHEEGVGMLLTGLNGTAPKEVIVTDAETGEVLSDVLCTITRISRQEMYKNRQRKPDSRTQKGEAFWRVDIRGFSTDIRIWVLT